MWRDSPRGPPTTRSVSPTFRGWPPRMPTRNFGRRTSRFSTRPYRRSSSRPKRPSRAPSLALDSEIGGINTTVAQIQAQLENAKWELSQTSIRASADGYVTVVALTVSDRALKARSAMSFIVEKEIALSRHVLAKRLSDNQGRHRCRYRIRQCAGPHLSRQDNRHSRGVGQGQIAVSGTLARTNAIGGATVFPAEISIPDGIDRDGLRLGMSGSATAFADNAGVIGLLASILVWVSSYTAYLATNRFNRQEGLRAA
jgi:hypothetical protein